MTNSEDDKSVGNPRKRSVDETPKPVHRQSKEPPYNKDLHRMTLAAHDQIIEWNKRHWGG